MAPTGCADSKQCHEMNMTTPSSSTFACHSSCSFTSRLSRASPADQHNCSAPYFTLDGSINDHNIAIATSSSGAMQIPNPQPRLHSSGRTLFINRGVHSGMQDTARGVVSYGSDNGRHNPASDMGSGAQKLYRIRLDTLRISRELSNRRHGALWKQLSSG